ncbi:MAG: GDSL-type esterase/lipase family protein [Clostridia bacterium]|jgi:lysophospholipase L1-like esterase|nr:hypothetical protein [Clostridiaceae bacterium]
MTVKVNLKRLEKDIIAIEQKPVQKGKILFYGDSCFRRWNAANGNTPLEEAIPGTLNHGFGSATTEEMLYYYPRAVRPYEPKIMVIKSFGNDMIFGYTPEEVLDLQQRLIAYARTDFPDVRFFMMAPLYNYGNYPKFPNFNKDRLVYDQMLKEYVDKQEDMTFVRVMDDARFTVDGKTGPDAIIRRELFIDDGIHFNKDGYDLFADFWKKILGDLVE